VLCVDPSSDLLAYMTEVLKGAGFEVKTARYLSDATTLAGVMKPRMIVCGPAVQASGPAFEKFRRVDPKVQLLLLSEDFNSFDACDAGRDLVHRVNELLRPNPDLPASPGAP